MTAGRAGIRPSLVTAPVELMQPHHKGDGAHAQQLRHLIAAGLCCRSEDLCRDPAIALQEFHGVAVGILDENSANSEIKRFIGRGDVAPTRLVDGELIRAQAVRQKQAGDLFEPGDLQGEVPRRVDFFKVGAGRHQVNRKMVPCEKPV
jgi:hypothetical protein